MPRATRGDTGPARAVVVAIVLAVASAAAGVAGGRDVRGASVEVRGAALDRLVAEFRRVPVR